MSCMADKRSAVGVIGESDIVAAFRTVGMHVADARTPQQAQQAVHRMVTEGVSVIYITEGIARTIPETLARYNADPGVAIIPIPGSRGTDGFGMSRVMANVEKAVGAYIELNDTEE